jgi:hypothetical protein
MMLKMKLTSKLLAMSAVIMLSGCATPPAFLANYYDARDPCQTQEFSTLNGARLKPAGYNHSQRPAWCGASRDRTRITNTHGQTIGYIR